MQPLPSVRAARATLDRSLGFQPVAPRARARKRANVVAWVAATALKVAAVCLLPATFVRLATEAYSRGYGTATTLLGAAGIVVILLGALVAALSWRLTGRARVWNIIRWVALPAVSLWLGYSLWHLARSNAKTAQVHGAYTTLHPILRLALSSAIVVDGDLVVTDAKRTADDYRRMGLPVFERTMHYAQRDSWVHAVDVRTIGHGEPRNVAIAWYFRAVGLRVVRHVGTADHLHVELPVRR